MWDPGVERHDAEAQTRLAGSLREGLRILTDRDLHQLMSWVGIRLLHSAGRPAAAPSFLVTAWQVMDSEWCRRQVEVEQLRRLYFGI